MTQSRATQVSLDDTPFYHVTCRCVRRSFLAGVGHYTRRDYNHRRQWYVDRMMQLTSVFTIDIAFYAIMSNHYHLVLFIGQDGANALSHREVVERWKMLQSMGLGSIDF